MLLSWFIWQVLSLENAPDWKESSHRLQVHDSEECGEVNPILGKQKKNVKAE